MTATGRRRTAFALIPAIIAALLVAPGPTASAAVEPPGPTPEFNRSRIVDLWRVAGPLLKAEAAKAVVGTDAQIAAFLENGWKRPSEEDDRATVLRLQNSGGPSVREAAKQALDAGTHEAYRAFLDGGVPAEQALDLRIRVNQIQYTAGPNLRQVAQQVLDSGSSEQMRKFVEKDWEQPHRLDQRIRVNQLAAVGGPRVKAKAQEALDNGTIAALTQFIEHDYAVARARDIELASVAELAGVAKDAGEQAARETEAAKQSSERAVREAELAKEAAEKARQATENAQGNAEEAARQAGYAADAASNAASAARDAVGAANSASKAASVAASAASRAASAASQAGQAAARAQKAAANAAVDRKAADDALHAAEDAERVVNGAREAAEAARAAGDVARNASAAATSANSASNQAAAAAEASAQAASLAGRAGADASRARAAAAEARAAATRANRAAAAAAAFANAAATAADRSRDAANRAADDAVEAARQARLAYEHAGNSQDAAKEATDRANAATAAAQNAINAATEAEKIYDAARTADAERVATERDQAIAAAIAAKAAAGPVSPPARTGTSESSRYDTEVQQWLTQARAPGADPALIAANGRKVAVKLTTTGGAWTKTTSLAVLKFSDDEVRDYVLGGLAVAAGQDDRVTLQALRVDGSDAFKRAADAALAGSDADVERFLNERTYPERAIEDRIAVNQVMAVAVAADRDLTKAAAQQALDTGTVEAYQKFLTKDQFATATLDDRVAVNRILATAESGPILKAAAQAALDGPPVFQQRFLSEQRFVADRLDYEQSAHNAEVSGYLSSAWKTAFTASQNANLAQEVAAQARNSAQEAIDASNRAQQDSVKAGGFATKAHESALAAEKSAQAAANSARIAQQAAASANASARKATQSSVYAQASANQARGFAYTAYLGAKEAYDQAKAAGESAGKAAQAFNRAIETAKTKIGSEVALQALQHEGYCKVRHGAGTPQYQECLRLLTQSNEERALTAYRNGQLCELIYSYREGDAGFNNCLRDVLDPEFELNRRLEVLTVVNAFLEVLIGAYALVAGTYVVVACGASVVCGGALLAIDPIGAAITPWLGIAAAETAGITAAFRLGSLFEITVVDSELAGARVLKYDLSDLVTFINRVCARSSGLTAAQVQGASCWKKWEYDYGPLQWFAREHGYDEAVLRGVAYNIKRYNDQPYPALDHMLTHIGDNEYELATYFDRWWKTPFTRHDSVSLNPVAYDDVNEVLLIKHLPNGNDPGMIHGYNYSRTQWEANKNVRYPEDKPN
ncbi:ALF repeat-containing protein [Lentzea sp. NPDC004782]|uniref:ALF repeat-containing protein n=1 Tax=Lentzea sp. NPDC004782 TaxID=3154458 RepID=UPI0033B435EA